MACTGAVIRSWKMVGDIGAARSRPSFVGKPGDR
jgi:hypothetical protein